MPITSTRSHAGVRRVLLAFLWCAAVPAGAAHSAEQDPLAPAAPPIGVAVEHPRLALRGFADVDFSRTRDSHRPEGFFLGQFVLHMSSSLGNKVSFFGETSFTAQPDRFAVEVERVSLRYDFDDRLKVSVGRFHTPVNYWNTAFHHGLWLQTTISRPEMIRGGGAFQPVHFVGLMAEGSVSASAIQLGYNVGIGNGRDTHIERGGDAGDPHSSGAWVAKAFVRPSALFGLEVGGSVYGDEIIADEARTGERILSGYVALTRESPEIISEYARVRHRDEGRGVAYDSDAFYAQVAYRFERLPRWKPYYRFEKVVTPEEDPLIENLSVTLSTTGVRYELSEFAALKAEYRHERRRANAARTDGMFLQAAWTF